MVIVVLAFAEDYIKDIYKALILIAYVLIFIYLAATKNVINTADAANYEQMFFDYDTEFIEITTEPSFRLISRFVTWVGGTISMVFFIYALISIPLKIWTLNRLTPYIFTALIIYTPVYMELHDLVQIRMAAAAAFLLSSIIPISKKKYLLAFGLIFCGIMFHYSSVIYLPFLLIGNRKLNLVGRIIVGTSIPIGFVMYFLNMDFFSLIPDFMAVGKLDYYKDSSSVGIWDEMIAPYRNIYFMSKCVLLYLCLYFYDSIVKENAYAPLAINIYAFGMFFLLVFATIPVLSGRVSDLCGVIDCIVFTYLIYFIRPRYLARVGVMLVGTYMLLYNLLYDLYF